MASIHRLPSKPVPPVPESTWEVAVHHLAVVDKISDSDYQRLRKSVRRSPEVALRQVFDVGQRLLRTYLQQLVWWPSILLVPSLLAAIGAPDEFSALAQRLAANPGELAIEAALGFKVLAWFTLLATSLTVIAGGSAGFRNRYDEALTRAIRKRCGLGTDIDVIVARSEPPKKTTPPLRG